eukprot:GHVP01050340.1.p1 GENE.GHVP01050340.1~~GHVP01050340.1.p1  ORF type:complete len:312 (+),score=41.27 GHVP01050340.1:30-965(+)
MDTDMISLTIRTLTYRKIEIQMENDGSVGLLKEKIKEKEHLKIDKQILIYKGVLLNNTEIVSEIFKLLSKGDIFIFYIEPANKEIGINRIIEDASDWDTRNKLKTLLGIYSLRIRDFKTAEILLTESLSVFSLEGFIPYHRVALYTLIVTTISSGRKELGKLLSDSDILETEKENSASLGLFKSIYDGLYSEFFPALLSVSEIIASDWFLEVHSGYIVREFRLKMYRQVLDVYSCILLDHLASAFTVDKNILERDIAEFIKTRRLTCLINDQTGYIERSRAKKNNKNMEKFLEEAEGLSMRVERLIHYISP